jgi:LysM repeat protein
MEFGHRFQWAKSIVTAILPEAGCRLRYGIMMDEFDDGVEPVVEEGQGSKVGLIAIAVAIVGIVVGIAGIVMANMAQKEIKTLETKLASQPDKTPELEKAVAEMDERLVKLGSEFVKLGRQDRQLQENTQSAFDSVLRDVKANRQGINEVTEKLGELVEKLEDWQPTRTSSIPASSSIPETSGQEANTVEASESGFHVIRSGDTLSKIAQQYGVSLSQLQNANPTVNPRALQIGQRIRIPTP